MAGYWRCELWGSRSPSRDWSVSVAPLGFSELEEMGNLINHCVNKSAIFQVLIYSGFCVLRLQGNICSCHSTSREVNEFESLE